MSELMKNKTMTDFSKEKLSKMAKKRFENKFFKIKHILTSYFYEINRSVYCDYINTLLNMETFSNEDYIFLQELIERFKIKRKEDKKISEAISKKYKDKYIFTNEHKKNLSNAKKGWKPTEKLKEKWSKQRSGRNNSHYCNDTILMLDAKTNNVIKEFYDCIEAIDYVKEHINLKAKSGEIFIACRENKIRYNHKWKQIKK
nr:hypothetical protein [Clostridia bacterium]